MVEIKSLTIDELKTALKEMGEKPFRAKQLYQWMHEKLAASLDECTNQLIQGLTGAFSGKFPADRTGGRPQAGEPR